MRDGSSTYKANQFIKSDSYTLKANTGVSIKTFSVSRIDGSATKQSEMLPKYLKIFPELPALIIRDGSCKKKEKVETLFQMKRLLILNILINYCKYYVLE